MDPSEGAGSGRRRGRPRSRPTAIQVRSRPIRRGGDLVVESARMAPSPSAQYSLTIRVEIADRPGMLGLVASAIGQAGASIGSIDLVEVKEDVLLRDITV